MLNNLAVVRQSDQGSADWLQARAGHATASKFQDILGRAKAKEGKEGKYLKARADYVLQLTAERLTGMPTESATSQSMAWGTEAEAYARQAYEMSTGLFVSEADFVKHPHLPWVGASSDGLVGNRGGVEIKCPHSSIVHLHTCLNNSMPNDHVAQVQGQMWVLDLDWVDFCSYDPRMQGDAAHLILFRKRIFRDQPYIDNLEIEVVKFLAEVQVNVNTFRGIEVAA